MRPTSVRRRSIRRIAAVAAVAAVATTVLTACGSDDADTTSGPSADGTPVVFVTTGILGDITENVVGDLAEVEVLLPPSGDPHDFEPSAQQVAAMTEADLVIANGLGLEEGLASTLESVEADGVRVFELGEELSPISLGGSGDPNEGEGADEEHDGTTGSDPHVWMDPDRMATASVLIAQEVAAATDLDGQVLAEQASAYAEEIVAADEEIQSTLAVIPDPDRLLVTNHEVFGYFAERYAFEVIGVVIPGGSTQGEPSAEQIADLATEIEAAGVPAIFADTSASDDLVDALAAEVGSQVEVVELYSESLGEPGSGADTYIGLITTNARRIADALG